MEHLDQMAHATNTIMDCMQCLPPNTCTLVVAPQHSGNVSHGRFMIIVLEAWFRIPTSIWLDHGLGIIKMISNLS